MLDSETQKLKPQQNYALLYEMIRSFTTVADTLNLSHAVEDLQSTRQTVRRHITQLERALGGELFTVRDRRYELTDFGRRCLPGARDIQARCKAWIGGLVATYDDMPHLSARVGTWEFHQQQHPIGMAFRGDIPIFGEALKSWSMAEARIHNSAMSHIRPFCIIYRQTENGWICVEFGAKSFYVGWFGEDYANSSIGRPLGKMPGGEDFARMLDEPFLEVQRTQSARLDHIFTQVPRIESGQLVPVAYQRLMMCGRFPDDTLAVMSLVVPTHDIQIAGVDPEVVAAQPILHDVCYGEQDLHHKYLEN